MLPPPSLTRLHRPQHYRSPHSGGGLRCCWATLMSHHLVLDLLPEVLMQVLLLLHHQEVRQQPHALHYDEPQPMRAVRPLSLGGCTEKLDSHALMLLLME